VFAGIITLTEIKVTKLFGFRSTGRMHLWKDGGKMPTNI